MSFDDYVAKKAALDEAEARLRALQDEARAQAEENSKARCARGRRAGPAGRGLRRVRRATGPAAASPKKAGIPWSGVRAAAAERGPAAGARDEYVVFLVTEETPCAPVTCDGRRNSCFAAG